MRKLAYMLLIACGMSLAHAGVVGRAQQPQPQQQDQQSWSVWGGTVGVRWNRDLAGDVGLRIPAPTGRIADDYKHFERLEVRRTGALEFRIENRHFEGFNGGSLQVRGGYVIDAPGGRIDLTNFRLVPRAGNPFILDIVGPDGKAWFYIDRLMYDMPTDVLQVRTMDVRISPALAARLGQPMVANWAIADMELTSEVLRRGVLRAPEGSCNDNNGQGCNWAGTSAPNGGTYQADLFMLSFSPQYSRCQGCNGPSGSGNVVFTPSSTLKNNVNAGSIQTTISGQGDRGKSSALWAADIPWFEKFSGNFPPYDNDQHPYLIWNMYRIDADGRIIQIGRSGVKHAFLTVNSGSSCPYGFGHVLGRTCEDTYGTGNNDSNTDLGPRSEIIPATNQWGRCGSIYDPSCTGNYHSPGNGNYDQRLLTNESQINTTTHPGSTWLFESWYLARQDINIYNSMGTVRTTQNWNGSVWGISGSNYKLGPAIDQWVDPANPGPNAMNSDVSTKGGHAKIAVKVTDLGGGSWRYDYAVMNFDFAVAVTEGSEPNLRVISNKGFDKFSIPMPAGATPTAMSFDDGDLDSGNDWTASTANGHLTWSAGNQSLDWGTLYSFSVIVNAAPTAGKGGLHAATASGINRSLYNAATLVPGQ